MRSNATPACAALFLALATACGPQFEVKPGPDDGGKPVDANVIHEQTFSLAPEIVAALGAQKQVVVPMPSPTAATEYSFPEVTRGKLKNGLAWYLVADHDIPTVSLNFVARAGTAHDPADRPGLAVFVGDMLSEGGTATRPSAQLADDIESLGADLTILTGADYTMVAMDGLSARAVDLSAIMAEMVTKPAFASVEMERYRKREMDRIALSRSDPEWVADEAFLWRLYGGGVHPYSRYDTNEEALQAITADDVKAFHSKHYVAANSFFVVVGDVDPATFPAAMEASLGKVPKGKAAKIKWPAIPAASARKITIVDRPGSAQTVIRLGNTTLKGSNPDAVPLLVTNHVLGGNASSRLFMKLREELGLTYGAYSNLPMRVDVGGFYVETSTKTASTADSVKAILDELGKLRSGDPEKGGVGAEELAKNQSYLTGVMPVQAQTCSRIADLLIDRMVYGLPDDYYDTYRGKVEAVTPAVLADMAGKYILPDLAIVVLVGDAAAIKDQVSSLGEIEIVSE